MFKKHYLEGSGLQGVVYKDWISIVAPKSIQTNKVISKKDQIKNRTSPELFAAKGLYGCTIEETGLFRTQVANGIMGLANDQRVYYNLYVVNFKLFTVDFYVI